MRIDELKKVCEAATPGPWRGLGCHIIAEETLALFYRRRDPTDPEVLPDFPDANFAATFNPELVKKLLAVVEAAEKARYPSKLPWTEGTQALHDALAFFRGA